MMFKLHAFYASMVDAYCPSKDSSLVRLATSLNMTSKGLADELRYTTRLLGLRYLDELKSSWPKISRSKAYQAAPPQPIGTDTRLSPRGDKLVSFVTQGCSDEQIANHLGVRVDMVKFWLTGIRRKVQVDTRYQLRVWGMDRGYGQKVAESAPLEDVLAAPVSSSVDGGAMAIFGPLDA